MIYKKDTLIANQALSIQELQQANARLSANINSAILRLVCIGGPLNDNVLLFNPKQLQLFHALKADLEQGGEL